MQLWTMDFVIRSAKQQLSGPATLFCEDTFCYNWGVVSAFHWVRAKCFQWPRSGLVVAWRTGAPYPFFWTTCCMWPLTLIFLLAPGWSFLLFVLILFIWLGPYGPFSSMSLWNISRTSGSKEEIAWLWHGLRLRHPSKENAKVPEWRFWQEKRFEDNRRMSFWPHTLVSLPRHDWWEVSLLTIC